MVKTLGRYEVLEELGRGAMGQVFRGRDPQIDRIVALKTIALSNIAPAMEAEFRQRFFREARAAGQLLHPGIVTIFDAGEDAETQTPFIVMEYIEGRTLEDIGQGERLPRPQPLELVKQIAEALDYAHSQGIVHRDIKPANIMVTPEGRAKIADFGVAKLQSGTHTQTGVVMGTPNYMSPEQLTGETVDGRSDLFSLGAMLYWLLTGEKPFAGESIATLSFKVVFTDPLLPSQLNPALGEEYDYLVQRALAKNPERRYQRGREFAADLEDLQNGRPPRSRQSAAAPAAETVVARPQQPPRVHLPTTPTPEAKTAPLITSPLAPGTEAWQVRRKFLLGGGAVLLLLLAVLGWSLTRWGLTGEHLSPGASANPPEEAAAEPRLQTATLQVKGEHSFRQAVLLITANGEPLRQFRLQSSGKATPFSFSVPVLAARHAFSVRLRETGGNFDQRASAAGGFGPGQTRTLAVKIERSPKSLWLGQKLTVQWID